MPLYEYQCKKCKHRFEKIQLFSDRPIKKCPNCGESAVEKLLSAPAVHFKGTGFYQTDYAKKTSPEASSATEAKADGKPAAGKSDSPSTESKSDGQKTAESKSEKTTSTVTESKPAPEPKGNPRGRSTHSIKARKK